MTLNEDTSIKTRSARWGDIPALAEMIADMARHHGDVADLDHRRLSKLIGQPNAPIRLTVAEDDTGLLGYAAHYTIAQLQYLRFGVELHHLFVRPDARRRGVGRALVAAVRSEAEDSGASYIGLSAMVSNGSAHNAYRAMGFQEKDVQATRFGVAV